VQYKGMTLVAETPHFVGRNNGGRQKGEPVAERESSGV